MRTEGSEVSLKEIREQAAAILASVPGVGVVHEYQRYATSWDRFMELFRHENADGDREINGWCITRTRTEEPHSTASHNQRTHTFLIRGFYGLQDGAGSELVFQDVIERICDAFRAEYSLNGTANDTSPIQVEEVGADMMGNVLCHYCELSFTAEEILAWE